MSAVVKGSALTPILMRTQSDNEQTACERDDAAIAAQLGDNQPSSSRVMALCQTGA